MTSQETDFSVIKPAWLPEGLYDLWLEAYLDAGGSGVTNSASFATEYVRALPEYEAFFPGIKRDDGSIRYPGSYPEQTWYQNMAAYRNAVEGVDVDPTLEGLESQYVSLIEGDVSPDEFRARVENLYRRVISQGDNIRNWYMENHSVDLTNAGIIASIMSDDVSTAVLEGRMTMAEIGGEATLRNFDVTTKFVDMLENQGMNRAQAQQFFGSAERLLPVLSGLAARHADPDDDFDLIEFAEAQVIGDPEQLNRIQRLQAQEMSTFTGGASIDYMRTRIGGVSGLTQS